MSDSQQPTAKLEQALKYAKDGLHVFPLFYVLKDGTCSCRAKAKPCKRIGKHPTTRNGLQDATTDEATIRRWWTESPHANIGLATGYSGLIVIDVDNAEIKDESGAVLGRKVGPETLAGLVAQYGELPETLMVETGSGGQHLYFYSTEDIKNDQGRKLGKDLDIRGYGGYVILPPSNHASGGKYKWLNEGAKIAAMPEWMVKKCLAGRKIDISQDELQPEVIEDAKQAKLSNEQLVRLLDFIPPDCDRDVWWQVGAALKKELGEKKGFDAWDGWSRKADSKYDPKVMRVNWESFSADRKGIGGKAITAGTIFHYAKTLGEFRGFDAEAADSPELKENWCYVAGIKRFVNFRTLVEWDRDQFDAMHAPMFSKGKASEHVLKNEDFRRVNNATYWPREGLWVEEFGEKKINYWREVNLKPQRGDVTPFLKHIEYLYPTGNEGKILLQYLAFQVQHPGEKVHWAVLLEGAQGNGKSYFRHAMQAVLGAHNVRMVSNEQLHEAFTGWQRNTQLVVVEEMMARQRLDLMNKLKPIITEDWCSIREMYKPEYKQPNRFNFLFFSNHKDSIIIDETDRRYCILKTDAGPQEPSYYAGLFDWTRKNGPALLHYLKEEVDLSDFRHTAHAPMTAGKMALIAQSRLPLDQFIWEKVEAGEWPFDADLVKPSDMVEPLRAFNHNVTSKEIGNALGRLGYLQLDDRFRPDPKRRDLKVPLWAVRHADTYGEMNTNQLRNLLANPDSQPGAPGTSCGVAQNLRFPMAEEDLQPEVMRDVMTSRGLVAERRPTNQVMTRRQRNPVKDREPM